MKRFIVVILLVLAVIPLSAADKGEIFQKLYHGVVKSVPAGAMVRKDDASFILFLDMKVGFSSSQPFNYEGGKKAIISSMKGTPDSHIIKQLGITVIYNYITTDGKIHSIVVTGKDF